MQEGGGGGRFASSCRGRGLLYWQVERTRTGSWREKLGCGQGSGSSCGAALPTHTPISCGQLAPTAAAAMFFSSQCHSLFALIFPQLSSYAFPDTIHVCLHAAKILLLQHVTPGSKKQQHVYHPHLGVSHSHTWTGKFCRLSWERAQCLPRMLVVDSFYKAQDLTHPVWPLVWLQEKQLCSY